MRRLLAVLTIVMGVGLPESLWAAGAEIPVGIAEVDITPDYPVRLNGFGFRREESAGVRQRIWAKALAIGSDASGPLVLIAADTLGIPDPYVEELAARLKQDFGITRDRIAVTASHTHTAPMVNRVSPTLFGVPIPDAHQAHIDRYTEEFRTHLYDVAAQALKNRQPAVLSWGLGEVRFAKNRRTAGGPVDHDFPLLAVKTPAGKLRAVYINYACHCVNLSDNLISGDWAGYAQEMIQRQHPGCTAVLSVGCGADSNPSTGVVGARGEVAESHGLEIAQEVNRLLATELTPVTGQVATQMTRIVLPLAELPTREEWERRAQADSPTGHHARTQLARLDRGEALLSEISYPIQTWAFGETLAMVFLPGEVVADYALRLKRELDGRRLWINAYANGCPGYVPSERVLKMGGYEGGGAMIYYDIPGPYATGLEDQIVNTVVAQLEETFKPALDADKTQGSLPRSPQQSLSALRVKAGFKAELMAAEPLVASPVAIDFAADGRLWVAEMYDYPSGVDNNFTPGGRVRLVRDTDGDGRYDASSVFLDGIPFPTGVTTWRNGVLVCAAPDILFAEDTDDDGRADVVRKLFSGFATHNYQARVNSLEYGLDGWVYGSCGLFGGNITSFAGGEPLALGGRDFRIQPDTGVIEPVSGNTQQGRVRDDWNNWFGCNNSRLLQHYPLTDHYQQRNPQYAPPSPIVGIVGGPNPNRVYPIADTVRFKLSGAVGQVTAACGLGVYRDDLLGSGFTGNTFTCEPVNNLVHRRVLHPNGVTFTGLRPEDEATIEVVASIDKWFRPVQARTGPDGGLWIVDMYRYVIEHPIWIPPEVRDQLDVRAGADMGRIYRVSPRDQQTRTPVRLDQCSTTELVAALDSPNGWQRDLATQMLLWQRDPTAISPLRKLLAECPRAEARLHALCTLDVLGKLSPAAVARALNDEHAGIRRQAVRIAEKHAADSPEVASALLQRLDDADPQVQLQLAYSLGEWKSPAASAALATLALRHQGNAYLKAAVFSSLNADTIGPVLSAILEADREDEKKVSAGLLDELFGQAATWADNEFAAQLLGDLVRSGSAGERTVQFGRITSMLAALNRNGRAVGTLLNDQSRARLGEVLQEARSTVRDESSSDADRIVALRLLGQAAGDVVIDSRLAVELLVPRNSPPIQAAAVDMLAQLRGDEVPKLLLGGWQGHSPHVRGQILDTLLSRQDWTTSLLDAVESKVLGVADIDLTRRQQLSQHPQRAIQQRAAKLLAGTTDSNRQRVIDAYASVLEAKGEASRGRAVFEKRCAACHRLGEIGRAVGPDLTPYSTKPVQALLIAVLDPNQAVDPRYHSYVAVLEDGRLLTGIITDETGTSLTLVSVEGKPQVVLRADLEELRNSGKSLMPEGLERDVSPQDLSDLWAWFAGLRPAPKVLAGNRPNVVQPEADGTVVLPASSAFVYGKDITFEPQYGNIGYWHGPDDHVLWQFELAEAGKFDVWMDAASPDESGGNRFRIEGGRETLKSEVLSTGGWDHYRATKLGTIELSSGHQELVMRPAVPLKGALLDLRALCLVRPGEKPRFVVAARDKPASPPADRAADPATLARSILNESLPAKQRQELVEKSAGVAGEVLATMVSDLSPGTDEEYRRIPWIWRVTIAAGKRNKAAELVAVLNVALPKPNEPLHDWQAVVLGGGVINGISLEGGWPRSRLETLLKNEPGLQARWQRSIALSVVMADNDKVRNGTRYDALRMVAMQDWDAARGQLQRYLAQGVDDELQMGAVSGCSDVDSPAAATALLKGIGHYSARNRELALDALLRTPARAVSLLEGVAAGTVTHEQLGEVRTERLRNHADAAVRQRAAIVLAEAARMN